MPTETKRVTVGDGTDADLNFSLSGGSRDVRRGRPMTILSSLTNRLFLGMALLAVLSIGAATYYATAAVTAQAEGELRRGVTRPERWSRTSQPLLEHFKREARLVADLPRFKATVALNDPPTLTPVAAGLRTATWCGPACRHQSRRLRGALDGLRLGRQGHSPGDLGADRDRPAPARSARDAQCGILASTAARRRGSARSPTARSPSAREERSAPRRFRRHRGRR